MSVCYLGLGGNVGDVVATMEVALDQLDAQQQIVVKRVSRVLQTAPVGADAGGPFLNAAAEIETELDPEQLLDVLKSVERTLGRTAGDRWSARVIDLDLLLFDSAVIDDPRLRVPHPHLWYRRFALDPLVEMAPDFLHPKFHETLGQLRARLLERPLELVLAGQNDDLLQETASVLAVEWPAVSLTPVRIETKECDGSASVATVSHVADRLLLGFLDSPPSSNPLGRFVDLAALPGTITEVARSVLTAALDEPRVYNRPLRRMP